MSMTLWPYRAIGSSPSKIGALTHTTAIQLQLNTKIVSTMHRFPNQYAENIRAYMTRAGPFTSSVARGRRMADISTTPSLAANLSMCLPRHTTTRSSTNVGQSSHKYKNEVHYTTRLTSHWSWMRFSCHFRLELQFYESVKTWYMIAPVMSSCVCRGCERSTLAPWRSSAPRTWDKKTPATQEWCICRGDKSTKIEVRMNGECQGENRQLCYL